MSSRSILHDSSLSFLRDDRGNRAPRSSFLSRLTTCLAAALLLALVPNYVWAQAAWEFTPYQVQAWIAHSPEPEFNSTFQQRLSKSLSDRAEMAFFAAWRLEVLPAPPLLTSELREQMETLIFDPLKAAQPKIIDLDKLFLVALDKAGGDYRVAVREVDCRTRQLGPLVVRTCGQVEAIPLVAWDAILEVFTPLARIEAVNGNQVSARLRSAGLITDPASPALIQPGDSLRPIIRRNNRSGEPGPLGIQAMPWTLLSVRTRVEGLLECEMISGYRTPIPARGGARTERLALLARARLPATRIILQSRGKQPRFLSGYEVFVKGIDGNPTVLVGITDWRGSVEIPRGDSPARTLYVRNGNQLLARLPLVPGYEAEAIATTMEDDSRLQAEGFVMSLQGRTMDLVARREILAVRLRKRIEEEKITEAKLLLEEYRALESRDSLLRDLDSYQQLIKSDDKVTQARIDKLFGGARKMLLNRLLDPETANTLAKEVEDAAKGSVTATGS